MSRYKAYSAYRDSGVEWLGEVPSDWDCVRLKFASELSGVKVAPSNAERYVGLENVQSNSGKFISTEEITPEGMSNAFSCGDVLFGKLRPYLAKSWLADFSGICSSEFLVLTSRKVDAKFLHYFTLTEEFIEQVDSSTYGSKMPRASWDFIGLLDIPVPPHESKKIAAFLDHETAKIDALIEKQQRLIELLKEKRQAVISHAVTKGLNPNAPMKDSGVEWLGEVPAHWEVATARRFLLEHKQGYYTTEDYVDDGVKLLRITDLRDLGEIDSSNSPRVKRTDTLKSFLLRKGDVIFARTGGAGSFGVVPDQHEDLAYASYLIRFRFAHTYFSYPYLRFMFASDNFQLAVKENIHGGVNQNLHAEDIKNTFIAVPPIEEQEQVSTYLSRQSAKYSHLIAKAESTVELMQERRSALISAAVTGKIDVRDWQAAA